VEAAQNVLRDTEGLKGDTLVPWSSLEKSYYTVSVSQYRVKWHLPTSVLALLPATQHTKHSYRVLY
jgi:hypothetical protein